MTDQDSGRTCDVCGKSAHQFCSSCRNVFYCSRECQKADWKKHKAKCKPVKMEVHPVYGRYLVATRDLKPSEIILKEQPMIIGPKQRTLPVCLGCHKSVTGSYTCSKCKFPLCSASCEKSIYHKAECEVFSRNGGKIEITKYDIPQPVYECIAPLRCLLMKKNDNTKYQAIFDLQSHMEDSAGTTIHKTFKRNVADFLRNFIGWTDAEEDEILRACGILTVNSFELRHNGQKVRGLYYQCSFMAHNCSPNTKHAFDDDLNMIVRATVPISKGSAVTTTYTQVLWNTHARQQHLQAIKYFLCTCRRCSDATELGTEFSTLICNKCKGCIRSSDPLRGNAVWTCSKCDHTLKSEQIRWGDDILYEELRDFRQGQAEPLQKFLKKYEAALHTNHRFFIEAKYALVKLYGNYPGFTYKEITREQLEDKVQYCRELLDIGSIILPGKSLFRGTVLFELQAGLVAMAKVLLSMEVISQAQAQEYMTEAVQVLQEATEILKHEPEMDKGGLDDRLKKLAEDLEV